MLWRNPACPVGTFQCGERLVSAAECRTAAEGVAG